MGTLNHNYRDCDNKQLGTKEEKKRESKKMKMKEIAKLINHILARLWRRKKRKEK